MLNQILANKQTSQSAKFHTWEIWYVYIGLLFYVIGKNCVLLTNDMQGSK